MKKSIFALSVIAAIEFLITGCASTKINLSDQSPIAVISIIGNTQVPWVDEEAETTPTGEPEAEGLLTSLANKFADGKNPENLTAIDRLDYAFDSASQIIPELTGCQVLPKADVIETESYKFMSPSYFNIMAASKTATGFKDFTTIGAKKARLFMNEIGANSALTLSFTFQKQIAKGSRSSGTIEGIVTLKAKLLDKRGREVINKIYTAMTPEPQRISSGQYDKDALVSALNDAIDIAIRQFCIDLMKNSVVPAEETKEAEESQAQAIAIPIRTTPSAQ